jgi:UTP--glucose-1-phosphate uridylyltransferase
MAQIKKAIIPIAGLGTRFLPLSNVLPKELWPLVDKPTLQYIVEEAASSGIKEAVFVNRPEKRMITECLKRYFRRSPELEKVLKARKKSRLLQDFKNLEAISKKVSFSQAIQKEPLGDGHAVLQAKKSVKQESFAVLFGDDIVESKTPCLAQLIKIFKKHKRPVLALYRIPKEKLPFYGVVKVKKIGKAVYEIRDIIEKPKIERAPSSLAIVGKYILTPDIFNYLEKEKGGRQKEIILANALKNMIKDGFKVFGLEFEGKWLECGNKLAYLKTNLHLCLKHPQFGKELKKSFKEF